MECKIHHYHKVGAITIIPYDGTKYLTITNSNLSGYSRCIDVVNIPESKLYGFDWATASITSLAYDPVTCTYDDDSEEFMIKVFTIVTPMEISTKVFTTVFKDFKLKTLDGTDVTNEANIEIKQAGRYTSDEIPNDAIEYNIYIKSSYPPSDYDGEYDGEMLDLDISTVQYQLIELYV